jgi:prepilin-type N-terminal cleavage/methylation domain-containing protein
MIDHLGPKMINRQMKNEKGFTLIEMLIAMSMGVVLLGAAVYTYSKQDKLLREENRSLKTRDFSRLVMDRVIDNLIIAGYGFPPGNSGTGRPARGITNADVTTLTYRANTENITTYVNVDNTDPNSNILKVVDTTDFTVGDNVVFFNVEDPASWNTKVLNAKNSTTLGWVTGALGRNEYAFLPQDKNLAVSVSQYHVITIAYNSVAQTITITDDQGDGNNITTTVANNITNLAFSYFDKTGTPLTVLTTTDPADPTELGEIRKVGVLITTASADDPAITETLLTDINLRNMGT